MATEDRDKRIPDEENKDSYTAEPGRMSDPDMRVLHSQLMREKGEPTEGMSPIPIFLIFVFAALMGWGGWYLGQYSGGFSANVFNPHYAVMAEEGDTDQEQAFDPLARGSRIYSQQCTICHQSNGQGVAGSFPPLAESEWVLGKKERVIKILLAGMNGPIEVLGETYNGEMPAFGQLPDQDIAAVLTFIRQEWGNDASPISPDLVAQVREEYGDRRQPWTADELLQLHPWSQDDEEEPEEDTEITDTETPQENEEDSEATSEGDENTDGAQQKDASEAETDASGG